MGDIVEEKTSYWIDKYSAYKFYMKKENPFTMTTTFYSKVYPNGKVVTGWDHEKVGFGLNFDYDRVDESEFKEFIKTFL